MIRRSEGERGVAILMVLFALLLLTGIALGLMYLTDTETGINSNFRSEQEAYYVARAGLEEARDRLRFGVTINGNNASLPVPANAGGPVCAVTNGNAATGFYPPYNEAPLPAGFNICENNNFRTVYLITSLGISRTGSRKMTQAETAQITLPPIPAAITFDGSAPSWNPPNSNASKVNGNDAKTCGPGAPNMPALGAYDPPPHTTMTT